MRTRSVNLFRLAVFFALIMAAPSFVLAQIQVPGIDTVDLVLNPLTPAPNQSVTAEVSSFQTNLNLATISWEINGVIVKSGRGATSVSFKTGVLGSKTTVSATIVQEDGIPITKSVTLIPASLNLIAEPFSYTPPFYRGGAYFTYEGKVKIVALASLADTSGRLISGSQLLFNWKIGDDAIFNQSGVGKNTFTYKGTIPMRTNTISVTVSSLDQKISASASIDLTPIAPKVILYEEDPIYGVLFNRALSNTINLNKPELRITAVPYFFDTSSRDGYNLKYSWSLNGGEVGSDTSSVVVASSGGSGQSSLSLSLTNTDTIMQYADTLANINFGQNVSNIFPTN